MNERLAGRYFVEGNEISEQQAAGRWFLYAQEHNIDISRAICLWEDAATFEGGASRKAVSAAGIRIEPPDC